MELKKTNNNELMNLQTKSEVHILNYNKKIIASLKLAEQRTGFNLNTDIQNIINDINYRFPNLKENEFIEILKNGSLGKYGQIYKLSTLQICLWIKQELNEDLMILNNSNKYKHECNLLKGYNKEKDVIYYFKLLKEIKNIPSLMKKDALTFEQCRKVIREEKKHRKNIIRNIEIIAGSYDIRNNKALNIGIISWLNNNSEAL